MVYFQLFNVLPNIDFIETVCNQYGIQNFDCNYVFSLRDLEKLDTIQKLNDMKDEFEKYYLTCKYNKYIKNLNEKKSITLLRQFVKIMGYKIVSREKYSNGHKYLIYNLKNNNLNTDDYNLTVNFN